MAKFSIRDLFLVTAIVAIGLGWWADHRRAVARDAEWERSLQSALQHFSAYAREEVTFESPNGPWRVNCVTGIQSPEDAR
ncbi:MAG: hypothetical protein IAF94_18650 [Pirellulaceae bacterium]|nr:hypothetical protein [Pirellulaceae bacterium]